MKMYQITVLLIVIQLTKTHWRNYSCRITAGAYGLLHFSDYYLQFRLAPDRFAKCILLERKR